MGGYYQLKFGDSTRFYNTQWLTSKDCKLFKNVKDSFIIKFSTAREYESAKCL